MRLIFSAVLAVLMAGCPTANQKEKSVPGRCTSFGEQCLYAPGKLGSCVKREGCSQGDCLVCQSQH